MRDHPREERTTEGSWDFSKCRDTEKDPAEETQMEKPAVSEDIQVSMGSSELGEDGVQRQSVVSHVKGLSQKLYCLNMLIYLSVLLTRLNFLSAAITS